MTTTIVLTWSEVVVAAQIGVMRQINALRDQRQNRCVYADNSWTAHVEGAAGELAFAKARGLFWSGMDMTTFHSRPDVCHCEVRSSVHATARLIVHDDDSDVAPFVLVRGRIPRFEIVGWLFGHEAKRAEWLDTYGNNRPAYFVPESQLRALDALP